MPKDGGKPDPERDPQWDEDDAPWQGPREQIVVFEADTAPMSEQVLLQLILARAKLKVLVKDIAATKSGFGPYVEAIGGSINDKKALRQACRGAKTIVLCGKVTSDIIAAAASAGVPHIVLLSSVGSPFKGGFSLFGGGELGQLQNPQREALVVNGCQEGMSYTIVRVAKLTDAEGGLSALDIRGGKSPSGEIGREDAALIVARLATRDMEASKGSIEICVASSGPGQPPEDWATIFRGLKLESR